MLETVQLKLFTWNRPVNLSTSCRQFMHLTSDYSGSHSVKKINKPWCLNPDSQVTVWSLSWRIILLENAATHEHHQCFLWSHPALCYLLSTVTIFSVYTVKTWSFFKYIFESVFVLANIILLFRFLCLWWGMTSRDSWLSITWLSSSNPAAGCLNLWAVPQRWEHVLLFSFL